MHINTLIFIDRADQDVTSPDVSDIESRNCEEDLEDEAEEEDESENVTSPDVSDIESLGDDIFVEDDVQGARALTPPDMPELVSWADEFEGARALTPPDMPELVCWADNAYGFAAQALGRSITPPDMPDLFSWVDNGEGRAMRGSGRSTTPPDMPELVLAGNDYGHSARTLGRSRTPPDLMMPDNDGWVPFLRRQELLPELQHFEKVIGVLLKIKLRGEDDDTADYRIIYQEESDAPPPYWCFGPTNPYEELLCVILQLRIVEAIGTRTEYRVIYGFDD
ncbi:uncharacterized protein LOC127291436 [Leptopilina boulardi]|uniref:uncharacterized protein LOC127291436 n=1 Tax=Leptopilina boulardi TaxID=63433 RepID=UPI0021F5388B|nr:uncharacterized protein LOC127291436 [Leptopilina boulardi]